MASRNFPGTVRASTSARVTLCAPSIFFLMTKAILSAKPRDAGADVSALEREIDGLMYALYGLTAEEIAIVEGAK